MHLQHSELVLFWRTFSWQMATENVLLWHDVKNPPRLIFNNLYKPCLFGIIGGFRRDKKSVRIFNLFQKNSHDPNSDEDPSLLEQFFARFYQVEPAEVMRDRKCISEHNWAKIFIDSIPMLSASAKLFLASPSKNILVLWLIFWWSNFYAVKMKQKLFIESPILKRKRVVKMFLD